MGHFQICRIRRWLFELYDSHKKGVYIIAWNSSFSRTISMSEWKIDKHSTILQPGNIHELGTKFLVNLILQAGCKLQQLDKKVFCSNLSRTGMKQNTWIMEERNFVVFSIQTSTRIIRFGQRYKSKSDRLVIVWFSFWNFDQNISHIRMK